jgi:4-amino-4-deoxy-L-arabinose transferase-like glycosyltransferase
MSQRWLGSWIIPSVLSGGIFLLVACTASHYGLAWDEPYYFYASDLEIQWLRQFGNNLLNGQVAGALQDDVIKAAWHWDPYHVPHPPFSRILSGLTKTIFAPIADKFVAYRLAPALFFALLASVMYLWMTALFDRATGLLSALILVLIPNLFGFAHLAVTDIPLAAMWFLTAYCFWRGLKSWRWSLALGIVWGLAISTKFPALLIPIPLLLWAHLYHRPSYANNLFSMIFLSPLMMIASQPYLWHETSGRIIEFLYEGLTRGYRPETNFPIYFFHRLYLTRELPWYYPFFMVGVTTPEPFLGLSLLGAASILRLRPQRDVMALFGINVLFILVVGLLPGAVLHDGMRQLLSALPFLTGLAGCGFFFLIRWLTEQCQRVRTLERIRHLKAKLIGAICLLILLPPALDLYFYHPYELSYYNRLVGSIRGAYHRGLEVTYFMEAFTPELLDFLNRSLPPNATLNASFGNFMFDYYQKENRLRRDIQITDKANFNYYILLTRRSVWSRAQHALFNENPRPYATMRIFDVPLVSIYKK